MQWTGWSCAGLVLYLSVYTTTKRAKWKPLEHRLLNFRYTHHGHTSPLNIDKANAIDPMDRVIRWYICIILCTSKYAKKRTRWKPLSIRAQKTSEPNNWHTACVIFNNFGYVKFVRALRVREIKYSRRQPQVTTIFGSCQMQKITIT